MHANSSGSIAGLDNYEINYQLAGMKRLTQTFMPSESLAHLASCWSLSDPSVTQYIVVVKLVTQVVDVFPYHMFGWNCNISFKIATICEPEQTQDIVGNP